MLPWRLGGILEGLGAMAMGAVLGMALGMDMAYVSKRQWGGPRQVSGIRAGWCLSQPRPVLLGS